jgi:hypothetical protein
MLSTVKRQVRKMAQRMGYDIVPYNANQRPSDFDAAAQQLFKEVQQFTGSGIERVSALREAVKYVVRSDIPGALVECGVWRGGSMMTIARTLVDCGKQERELYLFDTFSGMTPPTEKDVDLSKRNAADLLDQTRDNRENANIWCFASLDDVRRNMQTTGYDPNRIHYIEGRVEDTIPGRAPQTIALLRLDTDWYESTYHELVHLFPRLSNNGVLLIDDYGHWEGARRAVDQYIAEKNLKILLNRVDYTGRIAIKTQS